MEEIKKFWNLRALEYGEIQEATLPEIAVRKLEIKEIRKYIGDGQKIADIGCGNGYTTIILAKNFDSSFYGIDYAKNMIKYAKKNVIRDSNSLDNLYFDVQDCMNLKFDDEYFDVVYTERCIQNLPKLKFQKIALVELLRITKSGGKLILIECSKTGLDKLNSFRKMIGRSEIKDAEPWHNKFLNDEWVLQTLSEFHDIEQIKINHFASTYSFLTRILPFWRILYYSKYSYFLPNIGDFGYFKSYVIVKK